MRLNSSLALWLFSFHDILNDPFFSMTILVCLNCSERQSHQGKWWSYISLSDSFLSPYASRFTRWCRTLRVSDDALFLSDYSCLFSCLLGRVIKVMMINLFLCLTLFSTYASRGPTVRPAFSRKWWWCIYLSLSLFSCLCASDFSGVSKISEAQFITCSLTLLFLWHT